MWRSFAAAMTRKICASFARFRLVFLRQPLSRVQKQRQGSNILSRAVPSRLAPLFRRDMRLRPAAAAGPLLDPTDPRVLEMTLIALSTIQNHAWSVGNILLVAPGAF